LSCVKKTDFNFGKLENREFIPTTPTNNFQTL